MSKPKTVKLPGYPSYWDKANGVRVNIVDLGVDEAHGFVVTVVHDATGRKGLFVCVSPDFPRENRHELVRAMLASWARSGADACTDGADFVSALGPAAVDTMVELTAPRQAVAAL